MRKYVCLALLTLAGVGSLLAVAFAGYSLRDSLVVNGWTIEPRVFGVSLFVILFCVHAVFAKLLLHEIRLLNEVHAGSIVHPPNK